MARLHLDRDPQRLRPPLESQHAGCRQGHREGANLAKRFAYLDDQLARSLSCSASDSRRRCLPVHRDELDQFHGIDMSAFPNLQAFQARVAQRPEVQDAMLPKVC